MRVSGLRRTFRAGGRLPSGLIDLGIVCSVKYCNLSGRQVRLVVLLRIVGGIWPIDVTCR